MLKTADQNIEFSDKIGGTRVVFEGHPLLLVGGFNFDISELPAYPNVLPAGTPILIDEQARTIKIHYAFSVFEKVSNKTSVKIAKGIEGSRIKVGMFLIAAPDSVETAGTGYEVKSVDTTNEGYDIITLNSAVTLEKDSILIEATASGESAKVKVVPNCLSDRDKRIDPNAKSVNGDGVWFVDRPILERRIPPVAPCIKKALVANECYFRWSNRK